ncbi:hypothetical protein SAMN04489762_1260 [Terribacillus saccharophilus]|uniref:Uncharacterized protein n=1 Tax=Terribacillus saccharophilus TaxID=361277 RepID=A0AAX2EDP5_9BACI|nr:hypothetical protein SAMN04489762_1260 [Terribacillus saccharophilus]
MKKFFVSVLVLMMVLIAFMPSHSHAESNAEHTEHSHSHEESNTEHSEHSHSEANEGEGEFTVQYIPCPGGGKHTMTPHSLGEIRQNGKVILKLGYAFQCSKCLETMVVQHNPSWGATKLGTYGTDTPGFRLRTGYVMKYPDYVGYNSSLRNRGWDSYIWY